MNNGTDNKVPANGYKKNAESVILTLRSIWQERQDLNLRHPVLETGALPTELLS
jgi:hypothetical protein